MNNYLNGRTPIPKNGKIKINGVVFENLDNTEEIAAGSSCLVYHVRAKSMFNREYVLKEFYPILETGTITRDSSSNELIIDDSTKQQVEFKKRFHQFMQGVSRIEEISAIEYQNIIIPHIMDSAAGDSYYVVTEHTEARDLKKTEAFFHTSVYGKLLQADILFHPFCELEKNGYLMLDIKPENLLDDMEGDMGIRIVDTDSLYSPTDNLNDFLLLSNTKYSAPEVKSLQFFSVEEAVDIAPSILTPYATIYSLGKYLFEYFWERPFTTKNLYDCDTVLLLEEFDQLYSEYEKVNIRKIGMQLINVLQNVLIEDLIERMNVCYENIDEFHSAILDILYDYIRLEDPNFTPLSNEALNSLFGDIEKELQNIFQIEI